MLKGWIKTIDMRPIKRLFLVIPLMVLFILLSLTVVVPIIYYILTGNDWIELKDYIVYIGEC